MPKTLSFAVLFVFLAIQQSSTKAFQIYQSSSRLSLNLHAEIGQGTRRTLFTSVASTAATVIAPTLGFVGPKLAEAAPPIAIIAQELGYFPVTNREGTTVYVPGKVRRQSSEQSIKLARHLKSTGAVMYGSYWCPHCSHQKELFGAEAWSIISYVECSTKGFYYDASKVNAVRDKIEGFPTWNFPNNSRKKKDNEWVSGEMPLERIAVLSGFRGDFDVSLEGPDPGASGSCG